MNFLGSLRTRDGYDRARACYSDQASFVTRVEEVVRVCIAFLTGVKPTTQVDPSRLRRVLEDILSAVIAEDDRNVPARVVGFLRLLHLDKPP